MTANADYGVTIAEDFTPPDNWLPGQKVEKNVAVVNTGNVDAFVRTHIEGEMDIVAQVNNKAKDTTAAPATFKEGEVAVIDAAKTVGTTGTDVGKISGLTLTTEKKLTDLNLNYYYTDASSNKVYLKELSKDIYANPNATTTQQTNPDYFNEIQAVQAGGILAYFKTNAANGVLFNYAPNVSHTIRSKDGAGTEYNIDGSANGSKIYTVSLHSTQIDDIVVSDTTITVKTEADAIKYLGNYIDSDNFYPSATGLYIFRRNADISTSSSDYEFSGYYYVSNGNADDSLATTADLVIQL